MTRGRRIALLGCLAVVLAGAVAFRYLQTMPVGTGETRSSPDGRYTASVMDWSSRGFVTGEGRRWFEYRVQGPGAEHDLVGNPIEGPYFGSRSSHRVIRWSEDGSFVEFAFPDTTLRLTLRPAGPCRLTRDFADLDIEATADGFRVRPRDWQAMRSAPEMTVSYRADDTPTPNLDRQIAIGAEILRYDLAREAGGSGGEDVHVRAERSLATGIVGLDWRGQAEPGTEPDLAEAWALLTSVDCRP